MTAMATDDDVLETMDFKGSIPCSRDQLARASGKPSVKCPRAAKWLLTLAPCCPNRRTKSLVLCDRCKKAVLEKNWMQCQRCGHRWEPGRTVVTSMEPL